MGYDMSIVGDMSAEEQAALQAANDEWNAALAARDALKGQEGSWFTPEEEALPEEERQALGKAKHAEMDRLTQEGVDFWTARRRVYSIPPSEEYEAAQARVEAASEARYDADKSYFRLNIWGMSEARERLWELGMLKEDFYEWGNSSVWPDRPTLLEDDHDNDVLVELIDDELRNAEDRRAFAQTDEFKDVLRKSIDQYGNGIAYPTDEQVEKVLAYQEAGDDVLAKHDNTVPGIAIHKFGSNDGWLVTPEECRSAVYIWDQHPENEREKVPEYVAKFVEWIRLAAGRGGFRVY